MSRQSVIDSVVLNRPWYSQVTHDLFGISERLRQIDKDYFVLYNHRMNRWEVHNTESFPHTYSFVVPYEFLDARTLDYAMKTRRENTDKLLREMEENNERIKASKDRDFKNNLESASLETANDLRHAFDEEELHEGYKKTFGGITLDK